MRTSSAGTDGAIGARLVPQLPGAHHDFDMFESIRAA
jgi:hypothetical protein